MDSIVAHLISDVTLVLNRLKNIDRNGFFDSPFTQHLDHVGNDITGGITKLNDYLKRLNALSDGVGSRLHIEIVSSVTFYNKLYFKHTRLMTHYRLVTEDKNSYAEGIDINGNYIFLMLRGKFSTDMYERLLHGAFIWIRKTDNTEEYNMAIHNTNYGLRPLFNQATMINELCNFEIVHNSPIDVELEVARDNYLYDIRDER